MSEQTLKFEPSPEWSDVVYIYRGDTPVARIKDGRFMTEELFIELSELRQIADYMDSLKQVGKTVGT